MTDPRSEPDPLTTPGAYTFEREPSDEEAELVRETIYDAHMDAHATYAALTRRGVAKEVARVVLPVGTYSRMKWTCNLRSLMHFVSLRNSPHAQREIRDYAIQAERLAFGVAPVAMRAFCDNGRTAP